MAVYKRYVGTQACLQWENMQLARTRTLIYTPNFHVMKSIHSLWNIAGPELSVFPSHKHINLNRKRRHLIQVEICVPLLPPGAHEQSVPTSFFKHQASFLSPPLQPFFSVSAPISSCSLHPHKLCKHTVNITESTIYAIHFIFISFHLFI